jgi:hypothetical protein
LFGSEEAPKKNGWPATAVFALQFLSNFEVATHTRLSSEQEKKWRKGSVGWKICQ